MSRDKYDRPPLGPLDLVCIIILVSIGLCIYPMVNWIISVINVFRGIK